MKMESLSNISDPPKLFQLSLKLEVRIKIFYFKLLEISKKLLKSFFEIYKFFTFLLLITSCKLPKESSILFTSNITKPHSFSPISSPYFSTSKDP